VVLRDTDHDGRIDYGAVNHDFDGNPDTIYPGGVPMPR
jgi:hypothetical protein